MRAIIIALIFCLRAFSANAVEITSGEHGEFTRLFIPLAQSESWSISQTGQRVVFDASSDFSISKVFDRIQKNRIKDVMVTTSGVAITLGCDCVASAFEIPGSGVGIDVREVENPLSLPLAGKMLWRLDKRLPFIGDMPKSLGVVSTQNIDLEQGNETCLADIVLEIGTQEIEIDLRAELRMAQDMTGLVAWQILSGFWEEARATLRQSAEISVDERQVLEDTLGVLSGDVNLVPEALRCLDEAHFLWGFMRADEPQFTPHQLELITEMLMARAQEAHPNRTSIKSITMQHEQSLIPVAQLPERQPRLEQNALSKSLSSTSRFDLQVAFTMLAFARPNVEEQIWLWAASAGTLEEALTFASHDLFRPKPAQLMQFCNVLADRFGASNQPMDLMRLSYEPSPCAGSLGSDERIALRLEKLGYANGL